MDSHFAVQYSYLIPLLPLIGAALAGFLGARWLKGNSHWPIWAGVGAAAVLSFWLLFGMIAHLPHDTGHGQVVQEEHGASVTPGSVQAATISATRNLFTWIQAGNFRANVGFFLDPLTAVMLCVVTGIGFFITVFAKGYMVGEAGYFRFFAYLGLFIFAMTCLVMGENFLMLYLGWEGVGLCSYLLIGYYYDKPAAREAAKKAFLVNRVGDFGFGLGIMLIYLTFGTVSYFGDGVGTNTGVLELAVGGLNAWQTAALNWIPFLLMVGAFGKSAQFPLYVWLPDAMEGPTPVSALIHAATMVTAGVYMIARCGTLFVGNAAAMATIAIVGAFTAIFAASIALRQFDLKKVFAYSTISQLGFMFVGVGVLAPVAGVFHLLTHAFFKALLFLSSGVVMHAMMGELDMRRMSGLRTVLPKTRILMLIGCLALAGFPFLSGFFSKDEIVISALERSKILGGVMLLTALLTAYYTFRLYFRVFEGPKVIPPAPAGGHGHGHDQSHGHGHDAHAHASASAVQTGTAHESGVDDHLHSPAHVADTAHGGHGHGHHNHEPMVMILPLIVLAVGAVLAGYLNWPKHSLGSFLGHSPSFYESYLVAMNRHTPAAVNSVMFGQHELTGYQGLPHSIVMGISGAIAVLGIALAYLFHLQDRPRGEALANRWPVVTRLLEAKYWVDEVYQAGIVEPLRKFGRLLFGIDRIVVDGLVFAVGFVPQVFGFTLKLVTQRGSLQGYAAWMLLCMAVILLIVFM